MVDCADRPAEPVVAGDSLHRVDAPESLATLLTVAAHLLAAHLLAVAAHLLAIAAAHLLAATHGLAVALLAAILHSHRRRAEQCRRWRWVHHQACGQLEAGRQD